MGSSPYGTGTKCIRWMFIICNFIFLVSADIHAVFLFRFLVCLGERFFCRRSPGADRAPSVATLGLVLIELAD